MKKTVTAIDRVRDICSRLSNDLHPHLDVSEAVWQRWLEGFTEPQRSTLRHCPECGDHLVEHNGRYGAFLGCASYPSCTYSESMRGT